MTDPLDDLGPPYIPPPNTALRELSKHYKIPSHFLDNSSGRGLFYLKLAKELLDEVGHEDPMD